MTVTLTPDAANARVAITADSLGTALTYAVVRRSTDQIRWTTVRGATEVACSGGSFVATLYDYEYSPGVVNYYQVDAVSTAATVNLGTGTAATANNASVVPGLPGSLVTGDLMVLIASIRNSGTGTVNTPTGWTAIVSSGNFAMFGRRYVSGDAAPTVSFTGGVAGADTMAQIYARRNAELSPVTTVSQLNGSAQNIAYPAVTITADNQVILICGWKQDDWTSVATVAGATENAEITSTAGDDAGMVWDRIVQTTATDIAAGSFVVTGGTSQISRALVAVFRIADYITRQTASTTPAALTAVWLKSPQRPFLNQIVSLGGSDFTTDRASRSSLHDVAGRSVPVAVTELAGTRRWRLTIRTTTAAAAQTLEYLIAAGDVLYLHAPAGAVVPAGGVYIQVDAAQARLLHVAGEMRHWALPVTEVAPPGPDVAYALSTWTTVLALYATWADLLAANATWSDLLLLVGDPSEVVVP